MRPEVTYPSFCDQQAHRMEKKDGKTHSVQPSSTLTPHHEAGRAPAASPSLLSGIRDRRDPVPSGLSARTCSLPRGDRRPQTSPVRPPPCGQTESGGTALALLCPETSAASPVRRHLLPVPSQAPKRGVRGPDTSRSGRLLLLLGMRSILGKLLLFIIVFKKVIHRCHRRNNSEYM